MAVDKGEIAKVICCPGGCRFQICRAYQLHEVTDAAIKAILDGMADPSAEMWAAGANAVDRSKAFPGANVDKARATFFAMLAAERARLFPDEEPGT